MLTAGVIPSAPPAELHASYQDGGVAGARVRLTAAGAFAVLTALRDTHVLANGVAKTPKRLMVCPSTDYREFLFDIL